MAGDGLGYRLGDGGSPTMHLNARIKGSLVLDQVTAGENLDFFVLCASALPEMGVCYEPTYAVASRFMRNPSTTSPVVWR